MHTFLLSTVLLKSPEVSTANYGSTVEAVPAGFWANASFMVQYEDLVLARTAVLYLVKGPHLRPEHVADYF